MGRFLHQFGLDQNFSTNTFFSTENRLCFASTPTPPGGGTTQPPEGPAEQLDPARAALEKSITDLLAGREESALTEPEKASLATLRGALAALPTPAAAPAEAAPAGPGTAEAAIEDDNAGEQEIVEHLKREAEKWKIHPKFGEEPPLYADPTRLRKLLDLFTEGKPEKDGDLVINPFHELEKEIKDYDDMLASVADMEGAMAKIKEKDPDGKARKLMGVIAYEKKKISEGEKKLAVPGLQEQERKKLEERLAARRKKWSQAETDLHAMGVNPVNTDELIQKITKLREQHPHVFAKLPEHAERALFKNYEEYFTILKNEVSAAREKAVKNAIDIIDKAFEKRLDAQQKEWETLKPEAHKEVYEKKKAHALKLIEGAKKDLAALKELNQLSPEERYQKMSAMKEMIVQHFQISQSQIDKLKGMLGKKWTKEEYDAAVERRTELNKKELRRCKLLLDEGKMTQKEYDEAVQTESTFHKQQLKRFEHLLNNGWTQADCDEAIRIETEEQKNLWLDEVSKDPLKLREDMNRQVSALEMATEEAKEDVAPINMGELRTKHGEFLGKGGAIDEKVKFVTSHLPGWQNLVQRAKSGLASVPREKIKDSDRAETMENLEQAGQHLIVSDTGSHLPGALNEFQHSYETKKGEIEKLMQALDDPGLSPEAKAEKMQKVQDEIDAANAAAQKFIDTLTQYSEYFETILGPYVDDISNAVKGGGEVKRITWLDLNAIYEIWKKAKEYVKHRYERRTKERIGIVGEKLFDLPIIRGLGQEFRGVKESAERDAVETEKKNLTNADAWEIRHHMHMAGNKDVLKGMIELLADRGRLRFDDPFLWKQLNKYQHKVYFNIDHPSEEMRDYVKLEAKIQKAMGYIWEFEFFNNMKRNNDSKYQSKKEDYTKKCDQIAEQRGGLGQELKRMLKAWDEDPAAQHVKHGTDVLIGAAHNNAKTVDPHFYEMLIQYAITMGKMTPEEKVFYLIQGVSRGLLSYDRISFFDSKFINDYPIIEVFASAAQYGSKPILADFKIWEKEVTNEEDKYEPGSKFHDWFWVYALHKPRVIQRVNKVLSDSKKLDHDDATALGPHIDEEIADKMTVRQGNNPILPITGFENMTVGMLNYIEVLALQRDKLEKSGIDYHKELKRWMRSFVRYDAITDGRMYNAASGDRMRLTSNATNEPRSNGYYYHGKQGWTVGRYVQESRAIVKLIEDTIDPRLKDIQFFETIFNSNTRLNTKDKVAAFLEKINTVYPDIDFHNFIDPSGSGSTLKYPESTDEFYKILGGLIEKIIDINTDQGRDVTTGILNKIQGNLVNKDGTILGAGENLSFTAPQYDRKSLGQRQETVQSGDQSHHSALKAKIAALEGEGAQGGGGHH